MTSEVNEYLCFCGEDFKEHEKRHIRYACKELPFYKNYKGDPYCVLHYPDKEKAEDFKKILNEKFEKADLNFEGTYFPDTFVFPHKESSSKVNFSNTTFTTAAYFRDVIFHDEVTFSRACFAIRTEFRGVTFKKNVSLGCYFEGEVSFKDVEVLENIDFTSAFIDARLFIQESKFKGKTTFHFTKFKKDSHFDTIEFADVNFQTSRFFDDVSFHGAIFHKSQFTNIIFEKYASFRNAVFKENAYFFEKCEFNMVADFSEAEFEKNADFTGTTFGKPRAESESRNGAYFENASFQGFAIFEKTVFEHASFRWADFVKEVVFRPTVFNKDADFTDTNFSATANFKGVTFHQKAIFKGTILEDHLRFIGSEENPIFHDDNALDLSEIRIESPEKITFHTVRLRPSWFTDIDCRKFAFTKVAWVNADGSQKAVKKELLDLPSIANARQLFTITCRQLAQNFEENNDLEKASDFRRMAFETEWIEKKEQFGNWINRLPIESDKLKKRVGGSKNTEDESNPPVNSFGIVRRFDFLHVLYRFTSYYGESWRWALIILTFILAISAYLYTTSYSVFRDGKEGFGVWEAISYSLRVMALQRPEPQPSNDFAKIVVAFETVLGPLQFALLALAIRRKFMR